jgi:ribonucleotide monophosphatase NagD (HAD superfamily)
MIGDRLDTDILFAQNGGIDSLLVLSGCTSREDLTLGHGNSAGAHPTYVADDLWHGLDAALTKA